jgi:hypothetical protein
MRLSKWVFALAVLSSTSVLAQGAPYLTQHPGAACSPTNALHESYYRYDHGSLRNTGTRPLEFFMASCPLWESPRIDNYQAIEIRVQLWDSQQRTTFCTLWNAVGRRIGPPRRATFSGDFGEVAFALPDDPQTAGVSYEIECLVHAGATLLDFETLWQN